ncbi:hypothetical protein [Thermus scotoductus]|uniref:hypothetical protein n=1 Tax=Thermus scotoductus TaxID=37636 RepID=UPI003F516060
MAVVPGQGGPRLGGEGPQEAQGGAGGLDVGQGPHQLLGLRAVEGRGKGELLVGVGGEPRVCVVRRLEHLAYSALRGGKRRREQERAMVEGLLVCMGHLTREFPPEFTPVLEATRKALEKDLEYLRKELAERETSRVS